MPWDCAGKCGGEFFYEGEEQEAKEADGEIEEPRYECDKCDFALCYSDYEDSLERLHKEKHE